jgi:hypothetical protein
MGTPKMICEQVEGFRKDGVTRCAGLYFLGATVDQSIAAMRLFAAKVLPNFSERPFAPPGLTASGVELSGPYAPFILSCPRACCERR